MILGADGVNVRERNYNYKGQLEPRVFEQHGTFIPFPSLILKNKQSSDCLEND
jgi:hypothetical protein